MADNEHHHLDKHKRADQVLGRDEQPTSWEAEGAAFGASATGGGLIGAERAEQHKNGHPEHHEPHQHHTKLGEKIDNFLHSHGPPEHKTDNHETAPGMKEQPALFLSPAAQNLFTNLR